MIHEYIAKAWKTIAPSWPLKNSIACNPLQGFEEISFEEAIKQGGIYFQKKTLPHQMLEVNRETIKWCQAFFDEGQATIEMPYRSLGLYQAWRKLTVLKNKHNWAAQLPVSAEETIVKCLEKLQIPSENHTLFLTLLLTTLPGWASYVKCKTDWEGDSQHFPVTQTDYLAMRIVMACVSNVNPHELFVWHKNGSAFDSEAVINEIKNAEKNYQDQLLKRVSKQANLVDLSDRQPPKAQLVFCIDVRSEPFRRALENQGDYETFGFAGFFGIPVAIQNELTEENYASCPVLLKPKHIVIEKLICSDKKHGVFYQKQAYKKLLKNSYTSLKYTFTTPFILAEALGAWSGFWMLIKTFSPVLSKKIKDILSAFLAPIKNTQPYATDDQLQGISFPDQCSYAENVLRMVGLTKNFSSLVVFCGHGSETENNAYATALDCGACGGRRGGSNAKILAHILNQKNVRDHLRAQEINISDDTFFIAAEHNTTTDDVTFFVNTSIENRIAVSVLLPLKKDAQIAKITNYQSRFQQLKGSSIHWAQTRPEWGLARNASLILAPRSITKAVNLEGRAFLHSYDWRQDKSGSLLTNILTAPMVVAQWINCQYLFSCLNNIAYGSGSKITQNVTGKFGIMQGNGSDLMTGLPLQSLYQTDAQAYHEPLRLTTIVYAPRALIINIILTSEVLKKLFGNGWVSLFCIDPENSTTYHLHRDFVWLSYT